MDEIILTLINDAIWNHQEDLDPDGSSTGTCECGHRYDELAPYVDVHRALEVIQALDDNGYRIATKL